MAVTPTDIKIRYPEFTSVDDTRIQFFLTDAELELDEGQWGDNYDRGLSALTAHFLALSLMTADGDGTEGNISQVASKSVGDVSVSFGGQGASTGSLQDYFMSTRYGQEYWRLVQLYGVGMVTV